jgi:hypothetical protein
MANFLDKVKSEVRLHLIALCCHRQRFLQHAGAVANRTDNPTLALTAVAFGAGAHVKNFPSTQTLQSSLSLPAQMGPSSPAALCVRSAMHLLSDYSCKVRNLGRVFSYRKGWFLPSPLSLQKNNFEICGLFVIFVIFIIHKRQHHEKREPR